MPPFLREHSVRTTHGFTCCALRLVQQQQPCVQQQPGIAHWHRLHHRDLGSCIRVADSQGQAVHLSMSVLCPLEIQAHRIVLAASSIRSSRSWRGTLSFAEPSPHAARTSASHTHPAVRLRQGQGALWTPLCVLTMAHPRQISDACSPPQIVAC